MLVVVAVSMETVCLFVVAMEMSAKSLYDALAQVHEAEWVEHNTFQEASQRSLEIWVEYMKTLNERVVEPLTDYQNKFLDVRVSAVFS